MVFVLASIILYSLCILGLYIAHYITKNWIYYRNAFSFPSLHLTIPSFMVAYILAPFYKFDLYQLLRKIKRDGSADFYRIWLGGLVIIVNNSDYVQKLLSNPYLMSKSIHYEGVKDVLGNDALITAKDEKYKKSKLLFKRGFNVSSQSIIMENFHKGIEELFCTLQKEASKGWIKISPVLRNITTKNISRSALATEVDSSHRITNILSNVQSLFDAVAMKTVFPNLPVINIITHHDTILQHWYEELQKLGREMVECKKREMAEFAANNEEVPNQYIYNIIRDRADDKPEDVHGDIATLVLTAMDTSALTTSYALSLLAMHPEIQERVHNEDKMVQKELGGELLGEKDFSRYKYLTQVIKETLRLFPPVPVFSRHAEEDIAVGKRTIPKGCSVVVYIPYIHRNPDIYPDPLKFDPDRFLPENAEKRPRSSFIPFSYGTRQCPGYSYGLQSAILLTSSVVRKYRVYSKYKTVKELDSNLQGFITLVDKNEFPVRLEARI